MILSSGEKKILYKRSEIVNELCKPLFEKTLIKYFDYQNLYGSGYARAFTSKPDFIQELSEAELYPRLSQLMMGLQGGLKVLFLSHDLKEHKKKSFIYTNTPQQQRFNDSVNLAREKQIHHRIYLLSKKSVSDNIIFIGFGIDQDNFDSVSLLEYYMNIMPTLNKFIRYFESQINMLDSFLQKEVMALDNFADIKIIHPTESKIGYNISLELPVSKKYSAIIDGRKITFTKREAECLSMYFQKYTAREVSKKLLISKRTVETHLSNIRRKA